MKDAPDWQDIFDAALCISSRVAQPWFQKSEDGLAKGTFLKQRPAHSWGARDAAESS